MADLVVPLTVHERSNKMNHDHEQDGKPSNPIWKVAFIGFALVAGFFLITEHRAHVFGILPYLLLAACPLMHFFGHGHGGHGGHGGEANKPEPGAKRAPEPSEHQHH
jgi:hypothetical protein